MNKKVWCVCVCVYTHTYNGILLGCEKKKKFCHSKMDSPGSNINQTEKKQYCLISLIWGFPGGPAGNKSTCNAGDLASIPGSGRSPKGGKGYPLQYSGLENSMD